MNSHSTSPVLPAFSPKLSTLFSGSIRQSSGVSNPSPPTQQVMSVLFSFFIFRFHVSTNWPLESYIQAFRYFVNTAPDPTKIEVIILIQFFFFSLFYHFKGILVAGYVNG